MNQKDTANRIIRRLAPASLMVGLFTGVATLSASARDKEIVVGIIIDQLRTDYLEQLRPYLGNSGFNRLISEGVYLQDVDFRGTVKDAASGSAVIYTGAWPVVNGVAGENIPDLSQRRNVPALAADLSKSRLDYSPENIRLSTLSDEFIINFGNLAKVYSISSDPQVAVVTAGHAGSSAIWLDENSGRWTAPAYYGTLPPVIGNRNHTSPLSSRVAGLAWKPLHPASHYGAEKVWNSGDFYYGFNASRDSYSRLKKSATFNGELTELAVELLKTMHSPAGAAPGMLNISYSLAPYEYDMDGDNRPELFDSYIRLDAEIGRLIDAVYRDYGKENTVIFLTSTGYAGEPLIPEGDSRIPYGEISLKKVESLLNSYLSAAHGNGDYVSLILDGKIYLDRKTIENKNLDIQSLREEAANFLIRMEGIGEVYPVDEVLRGANRSLDNIRLSIDPKQTPDLLIRFTPGWTVTDDNVYPPVSEKARYATPPTPAFIMAPELLPETIEETVEATAIAPTIAGLMRIRAPNGAATKPLTLKKR